MPDLPWSVGAADHDERLQPSDVDLLLLDTRLQAVLGEQVAAAEKQVRARVDSLVDGTVTPVRARVNELQTQAQTQIAQQHARIAEVQKSLEQQLRKLTGGIRLP